MAEKKPCPYCLKEGTVKNISAQGLGMHLRKVHGIVRGKVNKIPVNDYPKDGEEEDKKSKKDYVKEPDRIALTSRRPVTYAGRDLALAEMLINAGLAKDLNDLSKKGLYVMTQLMNSGGANMDKKEESNEQKKSPMANFKEIMEAQANKQMIDMFTKMGGDPKNPPGNKSELMSFMKDQLEMKAMQKALTPDSDFNIKDILQFVMMKDLMGGAKENSKNSENTALQLQLTTLQTQIKDQKAEFERSSRDKEMMNLISGLKEGFSNNKSGSSVEAIKIIADKMEAVEKQKIETQKERDLRRVGETKLLETNLRNEFKNNMKGSKLGDALQQKIENEFISKFDFENILNKKEDTWEKAAKIFQPTLNKVADIVMTEQQRKIEKEAYQRGLPVHTPEDNAQLDQPPPDGQFGDQQPVQDPNLPPPELPQTPPDPNNKGFNISLRTKDVKSPEKSFYTSPKTSFFPDKEDKK